MTMLGMMQRHPLIVSSILKHAARFHGGARIVSREPDGGVHAQGYAELAARAAQLGNALRSLGVRPGDRVGTLAWNDHRHLEAYYAVTGIGAVCHTINPRLFDQQIAHIIADAGDRILLADPEFLPLLERIDTAGVEAVVALDDRPTSGRLNRIPLLGYEALLAAASAEIEWPAFDEESAALLCYTSGTTGAPKGVLYSHRATVLHATAICLPDVFGLRAVDRVMPIVPMYHVNAWGLPFAAAMVGAGQVLPGARPSPADLFGLIERHGVTFSAAVPTVWQGLRDELQARGAGPLPHLRIISGGAACPVSLAEALTNDFGIQVNHAWGMTEMSPVGLCNKPKPENEAWPRERWLAHQRKQGRALYGVEMRVVDAAGNDVAQDGTAFGELLVRGPWVVDSYYHGEPGGALDADGWFHTGDVVTMDAAGYVEIVDRAKDVIKSGGEWISSIALENLAVGHPGVAEAAVIAAQHPRWDERPLLIIVPRDSAAPPSHAELQQWMANRVAKWWLPDATVVVDAMPHTATGKLLKTQLKARYGRYLIDNLTNLEKC